MHTNKHYSVLLIILCLFTLFASGSVTAQTNTPLALAKSHLLENKQQWQLTTHDLDNAVVTDQYVTARTGTTHIYFQQHVNDIPVYQAILNINVQASGNILNVGSRFTPDAAAHASRAVPQLTAADAVSQLIDLKNLTQPASLEITSAARGATQATTFAPVNVALEPIEASLVYAPAKDGSLRLGWQVSLYQKDAMHWWISVIDAQDGSLLVEMDQVIHDQFEAHDTSRNHVLLHGHADSADNSRALSESYRVYEMPAESPIHDNSGRTLAVNPANLNASPFGWHDDDGVDGAEYTITRGNNVHAYADRLSLNIENFLLHPSPDGGEELVFDFPIDFSEDPEEYVDAAVTNLFYWNNIMHDVYYEYGFDEPSGNFQETNYKGLGGADGDYVYAEAQDGALLLGIPLNSNNANFATPSDGSNPRMQMYVWTTDTPNLDGDLDSGIIAHEYGHGISIRLTGGPSTSCLSSQEQAGEGWSDFFGLALTAVASDTSVDPRGVGTYALNQPNNGPGIRSFPYSTSMAVNPQTYDSIIAAAAPHGVGSVWATMIWDMYWQFVDEYGFSENIYATSGPEFLGNNRAIQLIVHALKLQPCSPGFVDQRDAILQANIDLFGGENQCLIWEAFARRGLGFSARQNDAGDKTDGVEGYDLPTSCIPEFTLDISPQSIDICGAEPAIYTVSGGVTVLNYTGIVNLSADIPANTTAQFSPTKLLSLPNDSTLTINGGDQAAPGHYSITAIGKSSSYTQTDSAELHIATTTPATPSVSTPANGLTIETLQPLFTWSADNQAASYTLEIATDPMFGNIVYTKSGLATNSFQLDTPLNFSTGYYWRVSAENACATGAASAFGAFVTPVSSCTVHTSTDVPQNILPISGLPIIPPVNSVLDIPISGNIRDVNVVGLAGTHTYISDLTFTLISPIETEVAVLAGVCGDEDDYDLNLDDEAGSASIPCPPTDGGTYRPAVALSTFDDQEANGEWTLNVVDSTTQDGGTLDAWGLEICVGDGADYSDSAVTYGAAWHSGSGALHIGDVWDADDSFAASQDDDTDDGISFADSLIVGQSVGMTVTTNGTATNGMWLSVWFDWNNDGDFDDADELFVNQAATAGDNAITIAVPASATTGQPTTYRVRLYDSATDPTASALNGATGGEVTDGVTAGNTPTAVTLREVNNGTGNAALLLVVLLVVIGSGMAFLRQADHA